MKTKRFQNKNVIITGATSGIGKAAALAFADEGASVILIGRNEERAASITQEINQKGVGSAAYFLCDVSSDEEVRKTRLSIGQKYSSIDVLFNNAGIFKTQDLEHMDGNEWSLSFNTNVGGVMYMTKSFIDILSASGGCIINNASVAGLDSYTNGKKSYMYASSKAALIKFSKLCALNYAGKVRVNVICPGIIDTEIYTNRDFTRFLPGIPMGYVADVQAVTGTVLFLASEEAAYITGAVLPVDGGMSLM